MKYALIVLLLTGCATNTGIVMHEGDAERCRAAGCTVWSDAELERLALIVRQRTMQEAAAICKRNI